MATFFREVAIRSDAERRIGGLGQPNKADIYVTLQVDFIELQFKEEITFPKNLFESRNSFFSALVILCFHQFGNTSTKASGRGNNAAFEPFENVPIKARLIICSVHDRSIVQFDNVACALPILRQ